jgi:hypothetical protein
LRTPKNGSNEVQEADTAAAVAAQRPAGGPPRDPHAEYADVRHRVHGLVGCLIDSGSTVAVVSKGDPELVQLGSIQGWHFPRTADGKYAGHHPADAVQAIAHLEQLRDQGAGYFLLPSTYFWWLDEYQDLAQHLRSRYRLVADCPDTCLMYDLRAGPAGTAGPAATPRTQVQARTNGRRVQDPLVPAIRALLDSLLPDREPVLVVSDGRDELLELGRTAVHFPHDGYGAHRSTDSIGPGEIAAQLTAGRARGLKYLVVPETARHGVEQSDPLQEPLREQGREVASREGVCTIYELDQRAHTPRAASATRLRRMLRRDRGRSDD